MQLFLCGMELAEFGAQKPWRGVKLRNLITNSIKLINLSSLTFIQQFNLFKENEKIKNTTHID